MLGLTRWFGQPSRRPRPALALEQVETREVPTVFTSSASLSIPNSGPVNPYPSQIAVSGLATSLTGISVVLTGVSHSFPDDIDVLLVGPQGERVVLMSDVGGSLDISNVNFTFQDGAAALPDTGQLSTGTFAPTNIGSTDTFASPAPSSPYAGTLSTFLGTDPNGVWSLYVVDDLSGDSGSIAGWSLDLIAGPTVSSIVRGSANPTNAAAVDFLVTFNQAVTGVDAGDFSLTATSGSFSGASVTGVSGSGTTYTVSVATGTGLGTLRLDLNASGTGIADTAGTPIPGGFTGGEAFTVDTAAPTILGVTGPADGTYTAGQHLDFSVGFSEAVQRIGTPRLALTIGGQTVYAEYDSAVGLNQLDFRYTVQPGDLDADGIAVASPVELNGGSLTDILGNAAVLTFTPPNTAAVLVDTVAPTVTGIVRNDASPSAASAVTYTVTFSEDVTGVDAGDFALTAAGVTGASVTGVSGSGTTYVVTVATGTGSGTLRLDVLGTGTGVADSVGSLLNVGFSSGEAYTLDRTVAPIPPTPVPPAANVTPPPTSPQMPTTFLATTAGSQGDTGTVIRQFDPATGQNMNAVVPFAGFRGPVSLASGDANGDGHLDTVVGAGLGGGSRVVAFDGATGGMISSFYAFDAGFLGGVSVAVGDVNGDGFDDIVVAAGIGGGPHVKVFSGTDGTLLTSFYAFDAGFTGGMSVAVGDVDGDGRADIVTGTRSGAPHVKVFSGADGRLISSFYAFDVGVQGGVNVAVGDVNGDGFAEIITGTGPGAGPQVKVFDGRDGRELASFFAFDAGLLGGVSVGVTDADGDGKADIVVGAGAGGGPHVKVFDGETFAPLFSGFAGDVSQTGGVNVG